MLTRWERATETFHRYSAANGIPQIAPTAFGEDHAGHLWIGFYEGGLARYRDGRFTLFTATDGVPAGRIQGLFVDHAGRLWVATSRGGLGRLDDPGAARPRWVTYTTAGGLSSNDVRCLTEDQWGQIYIGTGRGVDRLDPTTGGIRHYTTADGLASNEPNVAFRDHQGTLWFGALRGLSRLVPKPDQPTPSPPIFIRGLRIKGIPYRVSELGEIEVSGLELGANQNQLQVDFFGISFAVGEVLRYQYKLEGADQDWSALTDQRSINYASLSPGTYRFLVRAVSTDGLMSPKPAAVAFTMLSPVWQRWWFLTLVALVVGLATYAIHRYRVARLFELERVRARIATDLHDDIGASLSEMAILSEVLKQQIGDTHRESVEKLTEMAEKARALVDARSDIVWAIDPRRDDLSNLVSRVRQFVSNVLDTKGIVWTFQTPPELETVKLTPAQRRHLLLIFKEAINNTVRHAQCTSVTLAISFTDKQLEAEIRDDGCGFAASNLSQLGGPGRQGDGLKNMQARAVELGGQLRINSAPGRGTRLTLSVPLK